MVWIFSQMSACRKLAILAALFATLLMLLSCVNGSSGEQSATPLTDDLDRDSLRTAVQYSIAYLQKIPPEQIVGEQPRVFTAGEILDSLQEFDRLLDDWSCRPCFAREIERRFELVPSSMDSATTEVLFTGYYQPVIDGSLVRTEKFRYPVYGRPADLIIAERLSMGFRGVLFMWRTVADVAVQDEEGRAARRLAKHLQGLIDSINVVSVADPQNVPTVTQESGRDVLREGDSRIPFDGDVVVVVDPAEIVQAKMARQ